MAVEENKYLTFLSGKETYGMSILKVKSIISMMPITPVPKMPDYFKGIINLRSKIVPIIDLKTKFGLGSSDYTASRTCIIIVEIMIGGVLRTNGLVVDEVSEVLDITEGYIEPVPTYGEASAEKEFISNIGKIKDKIIMLLDVERLFAVEDAHPQGAEA